MKYSYSQEAAEIIANELTNTIPVLPPDTIVVNVPTITNHERMRGFDHSRKIAATLARGSDLEFYPALARLNQVSQVGAGRKLRLVQQEGAFRVRNRHMIQNRPVLLVDDVITTGATLESAASALKEIGVKQVYAVVFARSTL